jgi:nucleoside-diphosphate-sugar epimerase
MSHHQHSSATPPVLLLTGATGQIGRLVLRAWLEAGHAAMLTLRDPDRQWPILSQWLQAQGVQTHRVDCVRTDFAKPDLGWDASALAELKRVTCVAHFAAMWGWNLPWHEAEAVNVQGSLRLYEWALAQGIHGPFLGVCGFKSQISGSLANLGLEGTDVNWADKARRLGAYEVSKICAYQSLQEQSLRNKCLPVTWVHPATVIADTWVTEVPSQSAIVGILQAIRGGRMRLVPGTSVDMVPWVTGRYVAQYVVALLMAEEPIATEHVLLDPASPSLRASVDVMAQAMDAPKALGHVPKSWLAWVLIFPGVARWMGASVESLGFIVNTPPDAHAAVEWGQRHGVVHPNVLAALAVTARHWQASHIVHA